MAPSRPESAAEDIAETMMKFLGGSRSMHCPGSHRQEVFYCCVILTSSTPASARLAVEASAASIEMRTV